MAAIEEHKPVEKRRALGRGLDSLLPSGPRVVQSTAPSASPVQVPTTAASATPITIPPTAPIVVPPMVIPTQGTSAVAPEISGPGPELVPGTEPGRIDEIHASSHPSPKTGERVGQPRTLGNATSQEILEIPLDQIDENPYQTRRTFDEDALKELADSIKANGLAQPVVVRPGTNGRYVLVLGERRCRASKIAGKTSVPAIVRELGNEQAAEMTIVENLQRQDLNCLEQAQAFARLSRDFNLTQEQIGKRTGASRESVANYMRILKLPQGALNLLGEGKLGFSEARVLLEALAHTTPEEVDRMAWQAVEQGWTVRELKNQVNWLNGTFKVDDAKKEEKKVDPNVADAERRLREALGMRVRVMAYQGNKGQVVIRYESLADFDRILERLERDI